MPALSDTSQMWAQAPAPAQSKIPLAQDLAILGGGGCSGFLLGGQMRLAQIRTQFLAPQLVCSEALSVPSLVDSLQALPSGR